MSFNLYFAGGQNAETESVLMNEGGQRLVSQYHDRKLAQKWYDYCRNEQQRDIFVDSGAFTAWTKGVELNPDEYIQYLNNNFDVITAAACIDKIPGKIGKPATREEVLQAPQETWENYLYMRHNINPEYIDKLLPVFHIGEDFNYLVQILNYTENDKHIPYIGLGGTVKVPMPTKLQWYNKVFHIIKNSNNPNVHVHAFGMTSLSVLEAFPFYSADSTSWIMTGANGNILTPYGTILVSDQQTDDKNHICWQTQDKIKTIEQHISKYGLTLEECSSDYKSRATYHVRYLMDWAKNYEYKGNNKYQKTLF